MCANWRQGYKPASADEFADEPDELTWRPAGNLSWMARPGDDIPAWTGSARGLPRAEVDRESKDPEVWLASVRLREPPGIYPVTHLGRFSSVEKAKAAAEHAWASRPRDDTS